MPPPTPASVPIDRALAPSHGPPPDSASTVAIALPTTPRIRGSLSAEAHGISPKCTLVHTIHVVRSDLGRMRQAGHAEVPVQPAARVVRPGPWRLPPASGPALPPELSRGIVQQVIGGHGAIFNPVSSRSGLATLAVMKMSARTEYACVAMLELATNYGLGEPVPIRTIARRHGIPDRFLVQILLELKAAGLVASTRGAAGGYHLACPPAEVSLGQVMDVIGGSTSAVRDPSASAESPAVKVLMRAWEDVDATVGEMLGGITFAELVDRARAEDPLMYHI